MGKKLLILGEGGHGQVVKEVAQAIRRNGKPVYDIIDFLDDNHSEAVGKIEKMEQFRSFYDEVFCGIGNNEIRKKLLKKMNIFIVNREERLVMDLNLNNKSVLIIGASKGIGRGIVMGFAQEKCKIVAVARSKDLLEDVKAKAIEKGASAFEYEVQDIMLTNTKAFAESLLEKYGTFDVVVHNVGGSLISRNHLGGAEDWNYALKFNAVAAIDMNSVLIPPMIERGYGRVIHISSISAVMLRGNPLYASAKAFLNAYVTTVGRQLAPTGVLMCSVMPGAVAFEGSYWDKFVKEGHPRVDDFLRHHQAANRFGTPEEIANAIVFMASDKSSFMQATNIPVDGANM